MDDCRVRAINLRRDAMESNGARTGCNEQFARHGQRLSPSLLGRAASYSILAGGCADILTILSITTQLQTVSGIATKSNRRAFQRTSKNLGRRIPAILRGAARSRSSMSFSGPPITASPKAIRPRKRTADVTPKCRSPLTLANFSSTAETRLCTAFRMGSRWRELSRERDPGRQPSRAPLVERIEHHVNKGTWSALVGAGMCHGLVERGGQLVHHHGHQCRL